VGAGGSGSGSGSGSGGSGYGSGSSEIDIVKLIGGSSAPYINELKSLRLKILNDFI
jgi:hypothetical protein